MSLAGKVALVTGASSGIGRATAKLLAREGARVAATGRNQEALEALCKSISDEGHEARAFAGDVTSEADVKRVVASTIEAFTKVDVLVNSAGVLQGGAMGDGADVANFDFNMNVNAKGTFMFMMECVPSMKAAGAGSIVNVSSVNGMQSFQGTVAYCASKAAVDMMSRCAAVDLAPHKIRVNTINPGVVVTELQKRGGLDEAKYEAFLERSKTVTHPLGRVAEADEVAEAILFLASDKSGFITGAHLPIDGGRRCLGAR